MSAPELGRFDELSGARFKLVKSASDKYRRCSTRVLVARKRLRVAEQDFEISKAELLRAIDAVQVPLPGLTSGPAVPGLDAPGDGPAYFGPSDPDVIVRLP